MSSGDSDWVEDVRRWYFNGGRSATSAPQVDPSSLAVRKSLVEAMDLGYEAAQPAMQSRGWATTSSGELQDCR